MFYTVQRLQRLLLEYDQVFKYSSSFSSFPAALVLRLLVVYSHFKRAVGLAYELLYNRLSGQT